MARLGSVGEERRIDVGDRLRKIRKAKGLTIAELARLSQLSPSFISQAERDMTNPSVRTLHRLAQALEIDVNNLIGDGASQYPRNSVSSSAALHNSAMQSFVVRGDNRTTLTYHGAATRYELLAPELKADVEFLWVKAPPGTINAPHPFRHGGRECGVVISGKVEFRAGDDVYVLEPGDSIYLNEGVEHAWRVLGDEDWEAVWVIL